MAIEKVYKANMPLKQDGKYWYPITRFDQIIMADGSRWQGTLNSAKQIKITLPASGWQQQPTGRYTQEIALEDFTAETRCNFVNIDMSIANEENITSLRENWGLIDIADTVEGGIKFTAFSGAPQIDLQLLIEAIV